MDWINKTHVGDCRQLLKQLADQKASVQMCVTSPPYWNLRDYGVEGQLGLEPTLQEWIDNLVDVFECVRNVLADDGTLWVNLGDSYSHSGSGTRDPEKWPKQSSNDHVPPSKPQAFKLKDLIGQPWRLAFALQDTGWYLRSDIIWSKPNPMPESVKDRPTKSHEYVFLFSKSPNYYYNADAIKERVTGNAHARGDGINKKIAGWKYGEGSHSTIEHAKSSKDTGRAEQGLRDSTKFGRGKGWRTKQNASFSAAVNELIDVRNARSVWTIPTEQFPAGHFATFPQALVERCILAGSRAGDIVLDPFMGSGTMAQVATNLGRKFIGIELNPAYVEMHSLRTTTTGMEF